MLRWVRYESCRWSSRGPVDPRLVEISINGPDSRDGEPHFYPPSAHQRQPCSLINRRPASGLAVFDKTSIPGGILDSAPPPEQRAGVKTMGGPDRLTRIPTTTRAYAGGLEACRYGSMPPGEHFPHRVASATLLLVSLLDTVPVIPSRPSCRFYVGESSWVFPRLRGAKGSAL